MARSLLDKDTDLTAFYEDVEKLAELYRSELDRTDSVASGKLRSFTWDVDFNGTSLELYFNLNSYWQFIEYGRNPTTTSEGGVLYPRIRAWIDTKGINPTRGTRDGLAWAITKAIHRQGYFRPPLPRGRQPLANALRASAASGLTAKLLSDVVSPIMGTITVDLKDLAKR